LANIAAFAAQYGFILIEKGNEYTQSHRYWLDKRIGGDRLLGYDISQKKTDKPEELLDYDWLDNMAILFVIIELISPAKNQNDYDV
jgi:hypothetical protein